MQAGRSCLLPPSVALARELGMRPVAAHGHLGLGKLYRRTGTREQAQEYLTTATTMYREMDMRFWLEQAESEDESADMSGFKFLGKVLVNERG
jgi:hypothetical protein